MLKYCLQTVIENNRAILCVITSARPRLQLRNVICLICRPACLITDGYFLAPSQTGTLFYQCLLWFEDSRIVKLCAVQYNLPLFSAALHELCTSLCLQHLTSSARVILIQGKRALSVSPWRARRSTDSFAFVDTYRIPAMSPDSSSFAASAGRFLKKQPRLARVTRS